MAKPRPERRRWRKLRTFFALALVLSLCAVGYVHGYGVQTAGAVAASPRTIVGSNGRTDDLALAASLSSSLASLLGVLVTTLLAWRQELREGRTALLVAERQALEIERLRRVLQDADVKRGGLADEA